MTRRLVIVIDSAQRMALAGLALQILISALPPGVSLDLTLAVAESPDRDDEIRAKRLLALLGGLAQRIEKVEVEKHEMVRVAQPFLFLQPTDLAGTIGQVCECLARQAAQSFDGRNTIEVVHGIDPNRL